MDKIFGCNISLSFINHPSPPKLCGYLYLVSCIQYLLEVLLLVFCACGPCLLYITGPYKICTKRNATALFSAVIPKIQNNPT